MKRFFKTICLVIIMVFIFKFDFVSAATITKSGYDDCVSNQTCLLVCEWEDTIYKTSGDIYSYHVYAYYNFNGKWKYSWYYDEKSKSTDWTNGLPTKHVFYENDTIKSELLSKGICPSRAYPDLSGGLSQEVCFDTGKYVNDKGSYCIKKSDAGTKFDGSSKIVYTVDEQISIYFNNWLFENISNTSCSDFIGDGQDAVNNVASKIEEINNQVLIDFSHNFLYDNKMPEFMSNGLFSELMNQYNEELTNKITACQRELNVPIDSTELNEIESIISSTIDELITDIDNGDNPYVKPEINELKDCTSLLGNPELKGSPSYYLVVVFNVIKYVAIILLIILTIMDFLGAVASQDDNAIKKAAGKAIKRLILCIVIFVLPTLIEFILRIIHDKAVGLCGIGG